MQIIVTIKKCRKKEKKKGKEKVEKKEKKKKKRKKAEERKKVRSIRRDLVDISFAYNWRVEGYILVSRHQLSSGMSIRDVLMIASSKAGRCKQLLSPVSERIGMGWGGRGVNRKRVTSIKERQDKKEYKKRENDEEKK